MKFYPATISNIYRTTDDSVVLTFDTQNNHDIKFLAGQYITLRAIINGEEVRRSYSICSAPHDQVLKVGIKRLDGGVFSTFANAVLVEGDKIEIGTPEGKFLIHQCKEGGKHIFFAAGSGITPIFSMIRHLLESDSNAEILLFFVNRNTASIMFREELESLKNTFLSRFSVSHFLTQESRGVAFYNGRMNEEKLAQIYSEYLHHPEKCHYYMCGPQEMVDTIQTFLLKQNIPKSHIHFELFGVNSLKKPKIKDESKSGKTCDITVIEGGKTVDFKMEYQKDTILDAAMRHLPDLPYACKGGVCATCKAKVIEGKVEMDVHYGLEDDEIEQGYILTCQAFPISENCIVDFDV